MRTDRRIRATGAVQAPAAREFFVLRRLGGEWKVAQYMFQQMTAE